MTEIDAAVHAGVKVHGFLSGGGLRVFRLSRNGKDVGYGEDIHAETALRIAGLDYAAGGRPYECVYWTGSSTPCSPFDAWVLQGNTIDIEREGSMVKVVLSGYEHLQYPPGLVERVRETGIMEDFEARGYRYRSVRMRFANGDPGVSTSVVGETTGKDPWMYRITKTGIAATVDEAISLALEAPAIEERGELWDQ